MSLSLKMGSKLMNATCAMAVICKQVILYPFISSKSNHDIAMRIVLLYSYLQSAKYLSSLFYKDEELS